MHNINRLIELRHRTTVPVMLIHRRKGYPSAAVRALLALMSSASLPLENERSAKRTG